jgi:hypothetical protein
VPVDNEHVMGLSIVAWPLEDGAPKKDWRPGTDTVQDIRPGSVLTRKYEDRQRNPDDLEAQEGQRPIAVHALENLATSDTGITMLRHLLREQIKRVEDGLDPMNVMRDARANQDPNQRVEHHPVTRQGIRSSSERGVKTKPRSMDGFASVVENGRLKLWTDEPRSRIWATLHRMLRRGQQLAPNGRVASVTRE